MPNALLTRRVVFSASHRLHSDALSADENRKLFGKCNSENGHGHNYVLEVTVTGPVDPSTGILMNLTDLKSAIERTVMQKMDHKHLNLDVPELRGLNPTTENVAICIWKLLAPTLPAGLLHEVKLWETENNIVVYRGA